MSERGTRDIAVFETGHDEMGDKDGASPLLQRAAKRLGTPKGVILVVVGFTALVGAVAGVAVYAGIEASKAMEELDRPYLPRVSSNGLQNLAGAAYRFSSMGPSTTTSSGYSASGEVHYPGAFEGVSEGVSLKLETVCVPVTCPPGEVDCYLCQNLAGSAGTSSADDDGVLADHERMAAITISATTSSTSWSPSFDVPVSWNRTYFDYTTAVSSSSWKEVSVYGKWSSSRTYTSGSTWGHVYYGGVADGGDDSSVSVKTTTSTPTKGPVIGQGIFSIKYDATQVALDHSLTMEQKITVEEAAYPLCYVEVYKNADYVAGSGQSPVHPDPYFECKLVKN